MTFRGLRIGLALVSLLLLPVTVGAGGPHDEHPATQGEAIAKVAFDQNLGEHLPLTAIFTDDTGETLPLLNYFGDKPVLLVLSYFRCPTLCGLVFTGLVDSLKPLDFEVGTDFDVVIVSIDPHETAEDAALKKSQLLTQYNRPGTADGWHFLTGTQESIDALAEAVGFHYVYDEKTDQYAHPTGVIITTSEGDITRYLYGIQYAQNDLRLGLVEGSENKIGSPVDQFLLRCFHYDPKTGQYTLAIMSIIRFLGLITVFSIVLVMVILTKRNKRNAITKG